MPFLEITHLTGDVERRPLHKQQPVSIGSHSSNDLRIDEDGVELLHCRISWNKTHYEAVAAGVDGLDLNGEIVQRATLKQGDTLRFGSVDVRYFDSEPEADTTGPGEFELGADDLVGLKPLSEEVQVPDWLRGDDEARHKPFGKSETSPREQPATKPPAEAPKANKPAKPAVKKPAPAPTPPPVEDDLDLDAGLEALVAESRASSGAASPRSEEPAFESKSDAASSAASMTSSQVSGKGSSEDKIRQAMRHQRSRPGEEDILKSPLVIGLMATAVTALILAAIFYFVGFRRSIQEEFDQAVTLYKENKFAPAIDAFDKFIARHREHSLAVEARRQMGMAMIDEQITGAAPKYSEGMKAFKNFVAEQRDASDFTTQHPELAKRAGDIAIGAARTAGKVFDPTLIDVAKEARSSLSTFSVKESPPTEQLREIDRVVQESLAAILKHNTHDEQLAAITSANKAGKSLDALRLRRELLARYPDLETDKKIVAITKEVLEAERAQVKEEILDRPALTEALPPVKSLTLLYQARTRTDQVSVNRAIPVLAGGTLFGIDTVTGGPVWKVPVGIDSPFFPVRDAVTNSLIAFNSARNEVVRIEQNTGAILWRQPIEEMASGRPLIDGGQVFVPTVRGRLCRIELESGTLISRLTFGQSISNPVSISDTEQVVVSGDREVFYTLSTRPFACVSVSYLGQPARSIVAPLLAMKPYILAAQNMSDQSCRLRLIQTSTESDVLKEVAAFDVAGQVVDAPVIRGQNLFVPSTNERVAAFQISAEESQAPMVAGPRYEVKGAQPAVTHLSAAPDNEVFMASTAVRKLELKVDSLQPSQETILLGRASQPLQFQDKLLFVARQRPFASSIVLTPIDRVSMTGEWQAIAGARVLASSIVSGDSPSVVSVTESGQLFRMVARSLETGGFLSVAERLPLNEELVDPLLATSLGEGQLLVTCGLPEPKLWTINRLGQIERTANLTTPMEAAPAVVGKRILAPVKGGVQLLQLQSGQPAGQELKLPADMEGPGNWVSVVTVSDDTAVGVLANGLVLGLRVQTSPQTYVTESSRFNLQSALHGRPVVSGGLLAVAGVNGRVVVMEAENTEPRGERQFEGPIAAGPWLAEGLAFVEPGDGTLKAMSVSRDLPDQWALPLNGEHVAGSPLVHQGELIVPLQSGKVLFCDPASGEAKRSLDVQSALTGSPFLIGSQIYVNSLDGSLIRLEGASP